MDFIDELGSAFRDVGARFSAMAPKVAIAGLFLLVGWVGALFARRIMLRLLKLVKAEDVAEKLGVERFLLKGGIRFTTSTIIAQTVYWLILFFLLLVGLDYIGLHIADALIARVVLLLPRLFSAFVILLIGLVFSRFMHSALRAYLNNLKVSGADVLARVVHITALVFVVFLAIEQLDIGGQLLSTTFLIAFGSLALANGLAFGLAGKDLAADVLKRAFKDEP